jgi:hypothetical protein
MHVNEGNVQQMRKITADINSRKVLRYVSVNSLEAGADYSEPVILRYHMLNEGKYFIIFD